ncbi:MAG TPA: polyphosphate:AMP phosphotransferase [Kofleriaceae bacterium]|nr:polyphosphate:AMP phosphotransferase [Kofleriaceae bacterium]
MFEAAELGQSIDKATYERQVPRLREALLAAQLGVRDADYPVVVVIGGVDGAGKGETVNTLLEWMDPRHIDTFALSAPSDEERERPPYWRFWRALPPRGKIGIFFGGWHSAPIVDRAYKRIKADEMDRQLAEVVAFERLLVAEGTLLVKLWMHLSKKFQRRRLEELAADKRTRWRVTADDWEHFEMYDRFKKISEHALRRTSTAEAPWDVIEGYDRRYQTLTVGKLLLDRLRARTDQVKKGKAAARVGEPKPPRTARGRASILASLDMDKQLDDERYGERLEEAQGELNRLCRRAARDGVSTVVVYEGVDAAGKGGSIRRVTGALDARMYKIVPVAAPTDEERRYPYLWRFWRHIPRDGRFTVFDRSWYGRVLVERVEGFCSPADWQRAYTEINEFEEQLVRDDIVVVKLWMHITQAEQLRRFQEREQVGFKRFKITEEDWRNRKKWPLYERAVSDMIERTSTDIAPWTLVPSNDKKFARVKVLDTICEAMARAL